MNSTYGNDLVSAAQDLANQCRDAARSGPGLSDTTGIRTAMDCVQSLLFQLEPSAFLQQIAHQVRFLHAPRQAGISNCRLLTRA